MRRGVAVWLVVPAIATTLLVLAGLASIAWRARYRGTPGNELVGVLAPEIRLPMLAGEPGEWSLAALRGRPVLVEFFATWCPPCQRLGSTVAEFVADNRARGLAAVAISLDDESTRAQIPGYIAEHHLDFPVVGDGRGFAGPAPRALHVRSIPHLVLIDADGRIASADLAGGSPDETVRNLNLAVLPRLAPR